MYDPVVKCQRAGLCLSEHFLIAFLNEINGDGEVIDWKDSSPKLPEVCLMGIDVKPYSIVPLLPDAFLNNSSKSGQTWIITAVNYSVFTNINT